MSMDALFVAAYLLGWALLDLPLFVLGYCFGVGPDRFFYRYRRRS